METYFELIIHNDVFWAHIVNTSDLKDVIDLLSLFDNSEEKEYIENKLNSHYVSIVDKELIRIFGTSQKNALLKFLETNEGVITRSFIWRLLLKVKSKQDIDIFIKYDKAKFIPAFKTLMESLESSGYTLASGPSYEGPGNEGSVDDVINELNLDVKQDLGDDFNKDIFRLIDIYGDLGGYTKIQLVLVNTPDNDIKHHIINNFDLTVVKNYYHIESGIHKMYINNITDIVNRNINTNCFKRLEKYLDYGFKINSGNVLNDMNALQKYKYDKEEHNIYLYCKNKGSEVFNVKGEPQNFKYMRRTCADKCHFKQCIGENSYKHIHIIKESQIKKRLHNISGYIDWEFDHEHVYICDTDIIVMIPGSDE